MDTWYLTVVDENGDDFMVNFDNVELIKRYDNDKAVFAMKSGSVLYTTLNYDSLKLRLT